MTDYDETFDPEPHWQTINNYYYARNPADIVLRRIVNLLAVHQHGSAMQPMLAEGISFGVVNLTIPPSDDPDDDGDAEDEAETAFVFECLMLHHHTIETALRTYLGHAAMTESPWLEIAGNKSPGLFKDAVEQRFLGRPTDAQLREVACVVLGHESDLDDETKDIALNLDGALRSFARTFLDEGSVYNSAKHGMTAVPALDAHLSFGDGVISQTGPALHHPVLDPSGPSHDGHVATVWIDCEDVVARTFVAYMILRSVWCVGRVRYTDAVEAEVFRMPNPLKDVTKPPPAIARMALKIDTLLFRFQ